MLNTLTIENKDYIVVEKNVWQGIVDLAEDKCDTKWAMQMSDMINEQEYLPSEMVERILLHEENPLKVWREYRGFTGVELAKKVGISSAYLSDIENGKKDGSIKVLKSLAKELNVDIDDIV